MYSSKTTAIPTDVFYVGIDSRHRDTVKYPHANSYVVPIDPVFKNVISVELVHAIYDRPAGAAATKYVNLFIDEVPNTAATNADPMRGSFTQLPIVESSLGRSLVYDKTLFRSIKLFDKPMAKLSRLTISFRAYDGQPFDISDHYLRFEVTCMKTASVPEWRDMEVVGAPSHTVFQAQPGPGAQTMTLQEARVVLGLGPTFTQEDIKRAFVMRARLYKDNDKPRYDELRKAFKVLYDKAEGR